MTDTITSYKGFDKDLKCQGFQFALGQTFTHEGPVKSCSSGFHACEHPLGVFAYYAPASSRFALVEQSGDLSRQGNESKVASQVITVKEELDLSDLTRAAVEYTFSRAKPIDPGSPALASDPRGAALATHSYDVALATGSYGAASATGRQGTALATNGWGAALATGACGAALATGYYGAASATNGWSAASATGNYGAASATGHQGAASATGQCSAASATGQCSAASATGHHGAASATGDQGAASATGYQGAASATGYQGAASATGPHGVALSTCNGKAMAGKTGAIMLVYRNYDGEIVHIRASKVGENGFKAGTWYSLDEFGEFVEVS